MDQSRLFNSSNLLKTAKSFV